MFPFRTGVQSTTTEQQVYDSATDGIMTVTGQQYTLPEYKGPTATVQYGTEEQGYPRMLREIEQGELPQFRQEDFPEVGTGIMQPSTPVTQPIEPTPTEPEAPTYDPCPPGFKYDPVLQRCVPIQQPSDSDDDEPFVDVRTNNQKGRDSLENFGIKLTGGEDSIFADPKKTRDMFGTKQTTGDIRDTPKLASYEDVAARGGLSEEYRQALGPELYDTYESREKLLNEEGQVPVDKVDEYKNLSDKINELEATRKQDQEKTTPTPTGERFGQLPTFTVEDFETGYPSFLPGATIVNLLGQAFVAPSTISQLEKNGFIVKTGNKKNNKDEYTLSENGIRSIVQAGVDDDTPRMKSELRKQGFTQKQIDSGQALAEMRKDEGEGVDRRVKEYQERESKKYTQKQKDDFDKKIAELSDLTPLERAEKQRKEREESGGGGDSDKGGGKIVCTMMNEFYGFGSFRNKVWLAHSSQLSKEYEIGYHMLFLPLVKYAKQKGFTNSIVKNTLEHIARHRTIDIRKQKYNKVDMLGRAYRTLLEPLCYITGRIKLWKKK